MRLPLNSSFSLLLAGLLAAGSAGAITPRDLATRLAANERILLIDVRATSAYTDAHIPGALSIPIGLLPHKPLPSSQLVVVYGDGLGVVDESKALAIVRAKPGVNADALEGGYAGWLGETRLSTAHPGVKRETIPGISYQQLVAANKTDMVLVDLRDRATARAAASRTDRPAKAAMTADILEDFARKIGVPIVLPNATPALAASPVQRSATPDTPPRAAAVLPDTGSKSDRLLVLVADDNASADAAARQLRASGHYRFTVLIGGTEIISREGRTGMGRMDGDLPVVPSRP